VELAPWRLGMEDDRVLPVDVEDSDLEQRSVSCRSDEHPRVVVQGDPPHGVANGVPYARVRDPVPAR
jgi:hypothetical protein